MGDNMGKASIDIFKRENGFTLIEILVVIAILAVLAGIAIPNLLNFMHSGALEAANTEADNIRVSISAYTYDARPDTVSGSFGSNGSQSGTLNDDIGPYILNGVGAIQALYTISNGVIVDADPDPDEKWKDLVWDNGRWQ